MQKRIVRVIEEDSKFIPVICVIENVKKWNPKESVRCTVSFDNKTSAVNFGRVWAFEERLDFYYD